MGLSESIRFYAATDVGKVREHNEDNFLVDKKLSLFIVADGMGGHAAGEVASAIAVRTVHDEIKREKELLDDYTNGATGASKVTRRTSWRCWSTRCSAPARRSTKSRASTPPSAAWGPR
jgi:hypothetical protein